MKPRDRVLTAINHEEPDRVPICIGVSNATGMKMKPYRELKQLLGIDAPDQYIYDWPELGTAAVDEQTMRRLHSDVRAVLDLEPADVLARNHQRAPHTPWIDSWGSGQVELTLPRMQPIARPGQQRRQLGIAMGRTEMVKHLVSTTDAFGDLNRGGTRGGLHLPHERHEADPTGPISVSTHSPAAP